MPDTPVQSSPLDVLKVIDRLEVGPVRVEPRRLVAPYTVHQAGAAETFEFIYRFEEDVFDPADPESVNLSSMMAVQVALNYGLFCHEIVLHGPFDRADRQFLDDMARNTAREIYVKKFLQPNPFLTPPATGLPAVKRDSYLQARLVFPDAVPPRGTAAGAAKAGGSRRSKPWSGDRSKIAVLSSGGKESLLSDSLLREIGCETHAVFINESGKHWFTALNGYRYISEHFPDATARVWTNCDRLFSWMVRRLPFVRPDFARMRADIYPIRLWTVAVFLFGALPVLRKRGVGRLVIGDEFDTTIRTSHEGITHYDGLYDQSRYFDLALTRYFHRKGWGVSQFSILRPLSELLVEKILVERYPVVQQQQVSCHAAHIEPAAKQPDGTPRLDNRGPGGGESAEQLLTSPGDHPPLTPPYQGGEPRMEPGETATANGEKGRVYPCGQCEKCGRVVGMLVALGADPTRCGYTPAQIERSLENLAKHGAHQETKVSEHTAWLLVQKGLWPKTGGGTAPRKRLQVTKLRFDPERSPIDDIPSDLREPLYRIFLQHAEGAVKRAGRIWIEFDPLADPGMSRPYRFELVRPSDAADGHPESRGKTYLLAELTWPEAKRRFQETDVALLPVGAIEQHGHHLPLDTDAYDADVLCRAVAERCRDPRPIVLPLIPYGVSYHHEDFAGTISVSPETLAKLVYEVGMSVARHGITKLVVVNGHGGNGPTLHFAAQLINRDAHIFTCVDSGETSDAQVEALAETLGDVHAGEIETSTSLANRPHLVQMDKARRFVPRFSSEYLDFSSHQAVTWYARTMKISPDGVMGDPSRASREKGEKMWNIMIDNLVSLVEDLTTMTLDEIHQKSPV